MPGSEYWERDGYILRPARPGDAEGYYVQCFSPLDPEGRIVGENVINEINWDLKKANYRVAIFFSHRQGEGAGNLDGGAGLRGGL